MAQDYQSAVAFLNLPPEIRAQAGKRIATVGAVGILGIAGANYISSKIMTGLSRKIFSTLVRVGVSAGAFLLIDGFFAYVSDGKIVPISMGVDELISIVKPAKAATLGDHFTESGENFQRFLKIGTYHGVQIMAMNPELAATVRAYAQACREAAGVDACSGD